MEQKPNLDGLENMHANLPPKEKEMMNKLLEEILTAMGGGTDPYVKCGPCVERLKREYDKYGKLIIGFDFDDTLYDYHNRGHKFPLATGLLQRASKLGQILVCYTGTTNLGLVQRTLDELKIEFRWESPISFGSPGKLYFKPYFNILLDDRAGLPAAMQILNEVIGYIEEKQKYV